MNTSVRMVCALAAGLAVGAPRLALAGWSGQMNGLGVGRAGVNVTSSTGVFGSTNNPVAVSLPSAAMSPAEGYLANANLPAGANSQTFSRLIGKPGYIWSLTTTAAGGDRTDNAEIENRPGFNLGQIPHFSSLAVNTVGFLGSDNKSGVIRVNAIGTSGTAILLRGYEFQREGQPESLEDLKQNSILKWEMLIPGPFDLTDGDSGCNAIVIPFKIDSDVSKLFFDAEGLAASSPNQPPFPSATLVARLTSGAIISLSATDDVTAPANIKIFVTDDATPGFKAGPFKIGDMVYLRRNANQPPSSRSLASPYTAQVQTKGQARLVAEDDEGGATHPGVTVP